MRLNLEIAPAVRERIELLRERTGSESLTEVIRRSLAVYETLLELTSDSLEVTVRDKKGNERTVVLVP